MDVPAVDEDVTGAELEHGVRKDLSSLPESLAEKVTGHLVMVTRLLEEDPQAAAAHAARAHQLAPRITAVREALAVAAYRNGDYRTALREARTVRRMSGDDSWLPVVADCERALGRADRALELLREAEQRSLPDEVRAECLIVLSGVRRDLGQLDAALAALDSDLLRTRRKSEWSARLRFAYAETLAEAGRSDEAERWLRLAVASDPTGASGAAEALAEWDGIDLLDVTDESAEVDGAPEGLEDDGSASEGDEVTRDHEM